LIVKNWLAGLGEIGERLREETVLEGEERGAGSGRDIDLAIDVFDVMADRLVGDAELVGDFMAGVTAGQ
jgi:hypothetical protein